MMGTPSPARRLWALAPLIALAGVVLAAILVLTQAQDRQKVRDPAGRQAPAFALAALNGEDLVTPQAFAGGPYLINVFASWCVPCRAEHPLLMQLQAQGVPILGVAYRDEPQDTARFLTDLGDPYAAVGMDPRGQYSLDLGTTGVPETFVVDAKGTIVLAFRQPLTQDALTQTIAPALQRAGLAPSPVAKAAYP